MNFGPTVIRIRCLISVGAIVSEPEATSMMEVIGAFCPDFTCGSVSSVSWTRTGAGREGGIARIMKAPGLLCAAGSYGLVLGNSRGQLMRVRSSAVRLQRILS